MRIGIFNYCYPMASENFVKREAEALADLGNDVFVFKIVPDLPGPKLESKIPAYDWSQAGEFKLDVLYGSLSIPAHAKMYETACRYNIPFAFRLWSGVDVYQNRRPDFYRALTSDPKCRGTIAEDCFMEGFVRQNLGIRSKVFVIHNSLPVAEFKHLPLEQTPQAFAFGRFVEKKGFSLFVEAARELPGYQFVLAGDGALAPELKARATPNLRFTGWVDEEAVKQLIYQSRVIVAPCIQTKAGDADGVPTTVLEGFAAGRPAIGPDLLCMSEYIKHGRTGLLIQQGNLDDLVRAIDRLCSDYQLASDMGSEARNYAEAALDIAQNIKLVQEVLDGKQAGNPSLQVQAVRHEF